METIDIKIPYIKSKTYTSKEIDTPTMLNMVVAKLDQWKQDLSKPFTRKDALTLLTYKEDDDHILLKYGVNRNKWIDQEGREK
jgi:hypothetical protein